VTSKKQQTGGHAAPKVTFDQILASRERMNRASVEFLKIDLQTAFTFLRVARQTDDPIRKHRNCRAARRAYDTVVKLMGKVRLNKQDRQTVVLGLEHLRSELQEFGEAF